MLFFYNTKVYFFMSDDNSNRIGFYIWNEGDISSITIASPLSLNQIDNTGNYALIGIAKGSVALNYLILSSIQMSNAVIMMIEPSIAAGPINSFNDLWRLRILN
jgi:hypothetical protein